VRCADCLVYAGMSPVAERVQRINCIPFREERFIEGGLIALALPIGLPTSSNCKARSSPTSSNCKTCQMAILIFFQSWTILCEKSSSLDRLPSFR
jgi:hypothetical protein